MEGIDLEYQELGECAKLEAWLWLFLEMLILRNKKEEKMRGGEMGLEPIALQSMPFLQKKELPFKLELIGKFDFWCF